MPWLKRLRMYATGGQTMEYKSEPTYLESALLLVSEDREHFLVCNHGGNHPAIQDREAFPYDLGASLKEYRELSPEAQEAWWVCRVMSNPFWTGGFSKDFRKTFYRVRHELESNIIDYPLILPRFPNEGADDLLITRIKSIIKKHSDVCREWEAGHGDITWHTETGTYWNELFKIRYPKTKKNAFLFNYQMPLHHSIDDCFDGMGPHLYWSSIKGNEISGLDPHTLRWQVMLSNVVPMLLNTIDTIQKENLELKNGKEYNNA